MFFDSFRINRIIILITTIVILFDGFHLLAVENKFFDGPVVPDPRTAIAIESAKEPEQKLEYLVQFSERQARDILNPTLYTSFTWIYGGNACAYYYSRKKVEYYYSIDLFNKRIHKGRGLFLIQNGDENLIVNLKKEIILKNNEFTLFRL